jgi:hypothetical protein
VLQYPQIAGALLGLMSRRLRGMGDLVELLVSRAGHPLEAEGVGSVGAARAP